MEHLDFRTIINVMVQALEKDLSARNESLAVSEAREAPCILLKLEVMATSQCPTTHRKQKTARTVLLQLNPSN
jgi:hypothetical protein